MSEDPAIGSGDSSADIGRNIFGSNGFGRGDRPSAFRIERSGRYDWLKIIPTRVSTPAIADCPSDRAPAVELPRRSDSAADNGLGVFSVLVGVSNGSREDDPDKSVARQEMSELNMSTKSLLGVMLAIALAGNAIAFGDLQGSPYVVSVKRSAPSVDRMGVAWPSRDTFRATAATVQFLMEFGYELKHFERTPGLPEWAARERFDIAAKLEHPMKNMDDRRALVRQVLANEFGLLTHTDTRPVDVLALQRPKLRSPLPKDVEPASDCAPSGRPPQRDQPRCRLSAGPKLFTSTGASMAVLSSALSAVLQEQVIDKTGLEGQYRFTLRFASVVGHAPIGAYDDAPDLTTAVKEQLGLVLVRETLPMPVLVADRVNRPHLD